jgi:hypothetical protein
MCYRKGGRPAVSAQVADRTGDPDQQAAEELVEELDRLPLALEQAAAPAGNLSLVREIYDGVGRDDVAAILDRVTDDVDWSAEATWHAAPWHGPRTGKDGVASFFGDLATGIEIPEFTPHSFTAGENDDDVLVRRTRRGSHGLGI